MTTATSSPQARKTAGQRAHHIGQAAGLGKRRRLGGYHQDTGHEGIVPTPLPKIQIGPIIREPPHRPGAC